MKNDEFVTIPGNWNFNFNYFAGESASRFFRELRENRRIMGTRTQEGGRVLVPARAFDDETMEPTDDWVAVGPEGTLETFTIITAAFPGLPEPPLVMGYVTLDGADTALINFIHGVDLSDINAAAKSLSKLPRVKVEFIDNPQGRITDFSFRLV
ncbi:MULTISPECIES: OB-fold domain-containing protein [unclassified Chelatococcus]|uniref:Zn-ribbon domain-containing OB-fold protein n=1 Tax=unclassified Chelatococcus TaxID=2638111 RepID=UPI001BCBEC66|nr:MULTISPECIES: OB-fold domain-containing protein [unclassified Chelatococcus]CAH1655242.1 DNA-binding protein [Hyphomicrobiales bacterium]MBS7742638.1 OB-fold domain-containing protein [Chelatococcus sp. HY11]MBX3542244.1 OB-fold domain-containing protein [Chelatococcus sp.]MCO5075540.1 OB-fold domain-containing protein [Chelatococcus sp.]CAH1695387.1 DNA-binding protein [Hyphomicrobiales bacterium]